MSNPTLTTLVGFGANPKTAIASIDWTALQKVESDGIKSYLRALHSADRGRTRERERTEPGLSEFTLDNRDRRFEPEFASSPYSPNVLPGKPLRHGLGYMPLVIASKPVAYWRLGEAAGATAALDEMTVNPFNLTKTGAPTFGVAGRIPGNTAVEFFNNSADHLSTTAFTPALESGFTFAAWIKKDDLGVQRLIMTKGSATVRDIDIRINASNKAYVSIVDAAGAAPDLAGATSITAGTWYFVVGTWDDVRTRIYLNGALDGTSGDLSATPPRDSGNVVRIGRNVSADNPFDGVIDEVAIWDRALSATEIKALYDEGVKNIQDGWIWHGYMEGWPPSYPAFGKDAVTNAVAADALGTLALEDLISPYALEVLKDSPAGYWRLDETSGTVVADKSPNSLTGSYIGPVTFSQLGPLLDDGAAVLIDANSEWVDLTDGALISGDEDFSVEGWIKLTTTVATEPLMSQGEHFKKAEWSVETFLPAGPGDNAIVFRIINAARDGWIQVFGSNVAFDDFGWHHVACVKSGGTGYIYVDGALDASGSLAGRATDLGQGRIYGGVRSDVGTQAFHRGLLAELAIYKSVLSASRVSDHYDARNSWKDQLSGTRITEVLDAVSWPTADRDLDTGQSQIQAQDQKTNALSHILDVAGWEGGYFFPTKEGKLRYDDRHARLKSPLNTSQATFAWSPSGSEKPVRGAQLDFHLRNVKNYIVVERINGTTAVAQDSASITKYGKRKESRTTKVTSDAEALSDAQWTRDHKRNPLYEIEFLEIRPASDDALWTQVISRDIGDRITLILRPPGGGAQFSKDFHIEHVHHECITPITKDWLTRWRLSPAENQTYWIVEHATYGKVEQTTRVAW